MGEVRAPAVSTTPTITTMTGAIATFSLLEKTLKKGKMTPVCHI